MFAECGSRARDRQRRGLDVTTRGAAKRPATAGRIVVGARACNACSGTPRCAVVTSAAFACWLTTLMSMTVHIFGVRHRRMSVIERARQVQGLSGRRVRRARPSEPRAGTVTPLSVRTLTGGDVGIGRDVRPSYVQVGAGARMYGFTTRGGRGLPSIRALDNMDTPLSSQAKATAWFARETGPGRPTGS